MGNSWGDRNRIPTNRTWGPFRNPPFLHGSDSGQAERALTSGVFYGYVVIDVPALIDNLGGDPALAGRVVGYVLHLIATVSPGAKKGSTAS